MRKNYVTLKINRNKSKGFCFLFSLISSRGRSRLLFRLLRIRVGEAEEIVGDTSRLAQSAEEGAMDSGRIITDRVLAWKENCALKNSRRRTKLRNFNLPLTGEEQARHFLGRLVVVLLLLGRMRPYRCSQQVVIAAGRADGHEAVGAARPGIRPPSAD